MSTKRFKELKNLTQNELDTKIRETQTQLFQARMKCATGQLENWSSIWKSRKDLARMKMLKTKSVQSSKPS